MTRTVAPTVCAILLAALTGCGLGGRPSEDDLAEALRDPSNFMSVAGLTTDEQIIDCLAKALHDSEVSDETLQAIVDNDRAQGGNDANADVVAAVQAAMLKCFMG